MHKESQLIVRVLPSDQEDTAWIAKELEEELGSPEQVKVIAEEGPELQGKRGDAKLVMEVIQVIVGVSSVIQAAAIIARALNKCKGQKTTLSFLLEVQNTGRKVRILANDSAQAIEKKIRRILPRRGFFAKWLGHR